MDNHDQPSFITSKPKQSDLLKYVRPLAAEKWEDIGFALGLADEDDGEKIDEIKREIKGNEECFRELMKFWKRSSPAATWKDLLDALKDVGLEVAVDSIRRDLETTYGPSAEPMLSSQSTDMVQCTPLDTSSETTAVIEGQLINLEMTDSVDLTTTIDYSLQLEPGMGIRNYQHELAEPGINGKNYIVVAPTGSGKTLVAALVISEHLKKSFTNDEDIERKVVFIVNTRPLAQQQAKQLQKMIPAARVKFLTGDDIKTTIKDLLPDHNIIVCTAGKLRDDLNSSRVKFSQITLMVIDECHHTRKRHPHAEIMEKYLKEKSKRNGYREGNLPQVMGLTASPGAGDSPDLEKVGVIDHLVSLCALMDATGGIQTVRDHKQELDKFTNKPTYTVEQTRERSPTEPFFVAVEKKMSKLERIVSFKCTFEKSQQQYENEVHQRKQELEKSINPSKRDDISALGLLICFARALNIYTELRFEDAIKILNEFHQLPSPGKASPLELQLHHDLELLKQQLVQLPRQENPGLVKVESILRQSFEGKPGTRAIIFVRTKKHAAAICDWISKLPIASKFRIFPQVVTGHTSSDRGTGMTQAEQEEAIQSFHRGDCNVLVATSVAEEGIDVPACNLVIRYQHVSNEIAKAQAIGRARATGVSEGYTILSKNSVKAIQEHKNGEKLKLVEETIESRHFPTGVHLKQAVEQKQLELARKRHLEEQLQIERKKLYNPENVQLLCKSCKTPVCLASEIYKIGGHHVVPDESFKVKYFEKTFKTPKHLAKMSVAHKIFCSGCTSEWGISCTWPKKTHRYFPVLSCKSFVFLMNRHSTSPGEKLKKWSIAPFDIKPLSSLLKQFAEDEDSQTDSDC